jgi:hypothetical protein
MNIFRESEFHDDDMIQADRLEESLGALFRGDEPTVDHREDPELSELIDVGYQLRSASSEATERNSFHSFHMRSRAALLHTVGERAEHASLGSAHGLLRFIRARMSVVSSVVASAATAALMLLVMNPGTTATPDITEVDAQVSNEVRQLTVPAKTVVESSTVTDSPRQTISAAGLDFSSDVPVKTAILEDSDQTKAGSSLISTSGVSVTSTDVSPYTLSISSLESAIVALGDASVANTVSATDVRQVTDELARVGFEMRSGHPGAKYASDVEDFQNAIVQAILVLDLVDQSDPNIQASLIAARIVAEEAMHIATTYVRANQLSR